MDDDPLRVASYYGHAPVVRRLLVAGADVHALGDEALRNASYYGHGPVTVVEHLLTVMRGEKNDM